MESFGLGVNSLDTFQRERDYQKCGARKGDQAPCKFANSVENDKMCNGLWIAGRSVA